MSIFTNIKKAFKNAFNRADQELDRIDDKVRGPLRDKDDSVSVDSLKRNPRTHTVVLGDTLSGLALKYYGDASKYNLIFDANRAVLKDADKIYPGQVLRIPTVD